MNTLMLISKGVFSQTISANIFTDGGTLFMTLILLCLLSSLFFLIRGFMSLKKAPDTSQKMLRLASDTGLLGLTMGFLASIIGLISAFDSLEAMGNVDPAIFAGGLKISLLTATFGLFTFVISRLGIIILRMIASSEKASE